MANVVAIGLTGPFGSGCSTAAKCLRDERKFEIVKLSTAIRDAWHDAGGTGEPTRADLQRVGDQLREKHGPSVLVDKALEKAPGEAKRLVFETIRNTGEVRRLREAYGHSFALVAVLASPQARWDRIGSTAYVEKGLSQVDFLQDDQRDADEETPYGQEVNQCIDQADVIVDNGADVPLGEFKKKFLALIDLVVGDAQRSATQTEILMNMAYAASHSSKCLKRKVGALVVDPKGQVVGVGYNENPIGTKPCVEEPQYSNECYRDIIRNEHFGNLAKRSVRCPQCGAPLSQQKGPPWRCDACKQQDVKTNLEQFFFPDRAMNWCTAVHAEVAAILAAGPRSAGATLYTTTFPCFQCAEQISQVGIAHVYFTEAYPDVKSEGRLKLAKVGLRQFEGVRSSIFERIFSPKSRVGFGRTAEKAP